MTQRLPETSSLSRPFLQKSNFPSTFEGQTLLFAIRGLSALQIGAAWIINIIALLYTMRSCNGPSNRMLTEFHGKVKSVDLSHMWMRRNYVINFTICPLDFILLPNTKKRWELFTKDGGSSSMKQTVLNGKSWGRFK